MAAKRLSRNRTDSKGVAGARALNSFEDLNDPLEVWQAKGLENRENELGNGALAGRAGRGDHPNQHNSIVKISIH